MRWRGLVLLAVMVAWGCGAEEQGETVSAPSTPPPEHTPASEPARPVECNQRPPQTGPGCDQAGIQALVKAEIAPDRGVGRCYRAHARGQQTGRLLMRIILAPDGAAGSVEVVEDGLENPALSGCLAGILRTLRYPAPGDVPCTIIYPFNFQ